MSRPASACPNAAIDSPSVGFSSLLIASAFFVLNAFFAFRHVMWRDEWMPLVCARFTKDYEEFYEHIRFVGRLSFFSFVWLIEEFGGHVWVFRLAVVAISTLGIYLFCRFSPFTKLQKALFAFGYYPLYEYGTILRDYSVILALAVGCCVILTGTQRRPFAFGLTLAALFQTNPFGLAVGCALGLTYAFDMWRKGILTAAGIRQPGIWAGTALALFSSVIALKTMIPPPEIAEIVLGQSLRADSHLIRLVESLPFPLRGWLPIPLFGTWNTQLLDPWPWLQIALGFLITAVVICIVAPCRTALFLFVTGMLSLGAVLCHLPWTALRYHGPYFIILVLSCWVAEKRFPLAEAAAGRNRVIDWLRENRSNLLTGMLLLHVVVAAIFLAQEQVIPFSGSQQAAALIRASEPPDALVIGDPDYAMISIAGCLDRPVYIASRRELGSFTKVDKNRRPLPLKPEELGAVVSECLEREKRDVVLVTNYQVSMPPEMGTMLGATRGICDEQYFIFRVRYRRTPAE